MAIRSMVRLANLHKAWLAVASVTLGVYGKQVDNGLGCTAIGVDGRATADGSAYAGMNADCSSCDGRLAYIPPQSHPPGSKRPLYLCQGVAPRFVGYGRGKFYEPKSDEPLSPKLGEIDQVPQTYGYWEATLPLMNEVGLSMGESSSASRLLNYPMGQAPADGDPRTGEPAMEAAMDLTNMMQIAMERCATARCAVKLMGKLAEDYGFFPMINEWSLSKESDSGLIAFDDGGEALTIADRTGEAWVFHVVGGVRGVTKSVWAAQRLPPGHVAVLANNFIIRDVPVHETEDFLFSPSIRRAAQVAGIWNGHEPLDFTRVFGPDTVLLQSPDGEAPIPLYASLRIWRIFGLVAPKAFEDVVLPLDPLNMAMSVKAESKLEPTNVFALLSDLYQGTEFDLSLGAMAGPFGNPFPVEGGNATRYIGQLPRGISIARTVYSFIGQSRPATKGEAVMWVAPDTPAASVYMPFYAVAGGSSAEAFQTGTMDKFSRESAWWAFDFVANWASAVNWRHSSETFIMPLRSSLQAWLFQEMSDAEVAAAQLEDGPAELAKFQVKVQKEVLRQWWQLADDLVVAYNDGFLNNATTKKFGLSIGYPTWWARQVGFDQDVHPMFITKDEHAAERYARHLELQPPGYRPARSVLPGAFNFTSGTWIMPQLQEEFVAEGPLLWMPLLVQVGCTLIVFSLGIKLGRFLEVRKSHGTDSPDYVRLA